MIVQIYILKLYNITFPKNLAVMTYVMFQMLKSIKEEKFDEFERINSEMRWVEISEEKMKELESAMAGPEKKEFYREFARQRIITVRQILYYSAK